VSVLSDHASSSMGGRNQPLQLNQNQRQRILAPPISFFFRGTGDGGGGCVEKAIGKRTGLRTARIVQGGDQFFLCASLQTERKVNALTSSLHERNIPDQDFFVFFLLIFPQNLEMKGGFLRPAQPLPSYTAEGEDHFYKM